MSGPDLDNVPGLEGVALARLADTTTVAARDIRDEVVRVICERVDTFAPAGLQVGMLSRIVRMLLAHAIGAPPEHVARRALVIEAARTWYAERISGGQPYVEAGARLAAAVLALEAAR